MTTRVKLHQIDPAAGEPGDAILVGPDGRLAPGPIPDGTVYVPVTTQVDGENVLLFDDNGHLILTPFTPDPPQPIVGGVDDAVELDPETGEPVPDPPALEDGGVTTGGATYRAHVLSLSPLIYLPLNDAPGTLANDASPNNRDGVVSDSRVRFRQPPIAPGVSPGMHFLNALEFPSLAPLITVADAAWMDGLTAFTMEVWVQPREWHSATFLMGRASADQYPDTDPYAVFLGNGVGSDGQPRSNPDGRVLTTSSSYPLIRTGKNPGVDDSEMSDTGHMLTFTWSKGASGNGHQTRMYRDGVLWGGDLTDGSYAPTEYRRWRPMAAAARALTLGAPDALPEDRLHGPYEGRLSDFALYAAAHTPEQIANRYNIGMGLA